MAHKDNKGIFIMLSEKHQQNILHISNDAGFVKLITIKKENAVQQKQWLQLKEEMGMRPAELCVRQRSQGLGFYTTYPTDPTKSTGWIPIKNS